MRALTPSEFQALREVAAALGTTEDKLAALVEFESEWDPQASNPRSSAKGLLQFMDLTAREMGFASSRALVDAFPDVESQLRGPVLWYLRPMAPFHTLQSLAMAVFYPAFRNASPDTVFPFKVRQANPGIVTVSDYVRHVESRLERARAALAHFISSAGEHPGTVAGVVVGLVGIAALAKWLSGH